MNQLWILLLASCLLAGFTAAVPSRVHALDTIGVADDGSGDRQPDFMPPPTATGDPDWPITNGLQTPRMRPGARGNTVGTLQPGTRIATPNRLAATQLWGVRFQMLLRMWLAYLVR